MLQKTQIQADMLRNPINGEGGIPDQFDSRFFDPSNVGGVLHFTWENACHGTGW